MVVEKTRTCHELVRLIGELICYADLREKFFSSPSFDEALKYLSATREYEFNKRQLSIIRSWYDASHSPNVVKDAFSTTEYVITTTASVRVACPSWPCD